MFDVSHSDTLAIWESEYSHARETLILDFEHSPHLDDLYRAWKKQLGEQDAKTILENLILFLRTDVFDAPVPTNVLKFLSSHSLPLDDFVEHRLGVCRHFSLAAYYFLERMRREQLAPICSVEVKREHLKGGRHAWLYVVFEDASFHFDPYWGILESYGNSVL